MPEHDDMNIDHILSEAAHPEPSDALMARVLSDALAAQPLPAVRQSTKNWGVFSDLGGWFGVSGLAAATCAGFLIGFYPDIGVTNALFDYVSQGGATSVGEGAELDGFGWYDSEGMS